MESQTLSETTDQTASGSRLTVRAATFSIGGAQRGGVTLTIRVPGEFGHVLGDRSLVATLLLDPDEATGLGQLLHEAAERAAAIGPGLYKGPQGR
jgi:hypothetical protein